MKCNEFIIGNNIITEEKYISSILKIYCTKLTLHFILKHFVCNYILYTYILKTNIKNMELMYLLLTSS